MVNVELIYIPLSKEPVQIKQAVPAGTTVGQFIAISGLQARYPEVETLSVGVFSKPVTHATILKEGDRVEIYRPLALNPMQKRRERAKRTVP